MHQVGKNYFERKPTHRCERGITVVSSGQPYPSHVSAQIRYHINAANLKHYLTNKMGWSEATWGKLAPHLGTGRSIHVQHPFHGGKVQHMKYTCDLQATSSRKGHNSKSKHGLVTQCPCCCTTILRHNFAFAFQEKSQLGAISKIILQSISLRSNWNDNDRNRYGIVQYGVLSSGSKRMVRLRVRACLRKHAYP
jgi:hypothetical protein